MVKTRIIGRNLHKARKILNDITEYLDGLDIEYHLEGGTMLGFVRDGEFLEWDHDIDLSVSGKDALKLYSNRKSLWLKGYRVTRRRSEINIGPIRKGEYRIFKVKRIMGSLLSMFSVRHRDLQLVADIFVKYDDCKDTYWIAKDAVMKVPRQHYRGHEKVPYNGRLYKVPLKFKEYLTHKYGDWSVPVKEWDCSDDEKTVIARVS